MMKRYYIRKIELVSSNDYGTVLEIIANQMQILCPEEKKRNCERLGFVHCPTIIVPYTKTLHIELMSKKNSREPIFIVPKEYRIERRKLTNTNITKLFYVNKSLIKAGFTDKILASILNKRSRPEENYSFFAKK